ncbi:MAG TPA: 50S ribosomal protein L25 [Candidatus Desulfofervidus auxilii]|uniref:Large ribosomal subunit protein bL25 n=1 Tax=Desulfofervidus auxilii TaxID=1621989 RepID=A0A7V0NEE8_DESA2|nr:50S ribosomal protein L25 [Candidatus Desulfofervidus auxilii]
MKEASVEHVLKAQIRKRTGKEITKKLRRQGFIPAVLYGPATSSIPITVELSSFLKFLTKGRGTSSFIDLEIVSEGSSQRKKVLIKDMDFHPITDKIIHVDFYEIAMDKILTMDIPVVLVGKAKGVERGGVVEQHLRELSVSGLPHLLPNQIEIDVSNLDIGDSIHIGDIIMPEGVKIDEDPQVPVVTVVPPEEEVVVEEEAETVT